MRTCSQCNVQKRNDQFLTPRGKFLKMCLRCRDIAYKAKSRRKDEKFQEDLKNLDEPSTSENLSEKIKKYNQNDTGLKNVPLRDFIDEKKKGIQKSIKGFSKSAMIKYFENVEPEIGEALKLIESEELKDLIKIWMNEKFIQYMEESETELSEYED
jgi:hypothetical protein